MKILFFFLFPAFLFAQPLYVKNPLRFLALGDSYTIGQNVSTAERWPVQLKDSLALRGIATQTLRVIATTGWRTDNLLNAIAGQNLENQNYNLVSLLIGVNNQYQGKPFTQYKTEFIALVDSAIRYAGGQKSQVFIVSIPDYAYTPAGQQSSNPQQISNEIDLYNIYNKHIADSLQIKYFNITPISREGLNSPGLVANDGLHPSGSQYTQWVSLMLKEIEQNVVGIPRKNEKKTEQVIFLTPNPFTDKITLYLPEFSAGDTGEYEILDVTGRTLFSGLLKAANTEFDLGMQPAGLYFVRVKTATAQYAKRVVKTR